MFNVTLDKSAEDMLLWLKLRDKSMHIRISEALDALVEKGIYHTQVHRLDDPEPIYRRRVGRWRILFTPEADNELAVWIIDVEKDTRKDYGNWISKIKARKRLKFG